MARRLFNDPFPSTLLCSRRTALMIAAVALVSSFTSGLAAPSPDVDVAAEYKACVESGAAESICDEWLALDPNLSKKAQTTKQAAELQRGKDAQVASSLIGTWVIENWVSKPQSPPPPGYQWSADQTTHAGQLTIQRQISPNEYVGEMYVTCISCSPRTFANERVQVSISGASVTMTTTVLNSNDGWSPEHFTLTLTGSTMSGTEISNTNVRGGPGGAFDSRWGGEVTFRKQ